jgi:hypothetical protein
VMEEWNCRAGRELPAKRMARAHVPVNGGKGAGKGAPTVMTNGTGACSCQWWEGSGEESADSDDEWALIVTRGPVHSYLVLSRLI